MSKDSIPVLRLLFWNVGRLPRNEMIVSICQEHQVDVLVLAEFVDTSPTLASQLTSHGLTQLDPKEERKTRLWCFARSALGFREVYEDVSGKLSLFEFFWNGERLNLATAHLASQLRVDRSNLDSLAIEIADAIRQQENTRSNDRTVLIGDLNLNPFDRGLVENKGFHAVMSKSQARDLSRKVHGRTYPFFYNPMWGYLGDRTPGPPGTFYYRESVPVSYDWNTFDQVLLRPSVLELLDEEVAVLEKCNDRSLLDHNGRPDPNVGSDHLPLLVTLRWKGSSL